MCICACGMFMPICKHAHMNVCLCVYVYVHTYVPVCIILGKYSERLTWDELVRTPLFWLTWVMGKWHYWNLLLAGEVKSSPDALMTSAWVCSENLCSLFNSSLVTGAPRAAKQELSKARDLGFFSLHLPNPRHSLTLLGLIMIVSRYCRAPGIQCCSVLSHQHHAGCGWGP